MDQSDEKTRAAAYSKIVAMAWSDPDFKSKLIADPKAVLTSMGLKVPSDLTVKVVENTLQTFHLVIPEQPQVELMGHRERCVITVRG